MIKSNQSFCKYLIVRFKAKKFVNNSSLLQILFVKTGVTTKTSDVTDCFSSINKSYSKKKKKVSEYPRPHPSFPIFPEVKTTWR